MNIQENNNTPPATKSDSKMISVLVLDDEPGIQNFLLRGLQKHFSLVEVADDVSSAETLRQRCHFDLIIADIRLPGKSGLEWILELREQGDNTGVIFMTGHADLETAITALRAGAEDFIMKPFRIEQLITAVKRYLERKKFQRENYVLKRQVNNIYGTPGFKSGMIGNCEAMHSVCQVIKRIAPMPSTVLIEGESGTGKELAARAIHEWSGRSGSLVPINCGAVSSELLESELFGHIKGAYTGAHQARDGLFSYADGGSLFLDEIGEMPLSMQAHLLRVIESRQVRPVGSNCEIPVDVRIIAATNKDLSEMVKLGKFREDLYYRLNVVSIRMPSLRERVKDIPMLILHFVETLSKDLGLEAPHISEAEIKRLCSYNWPGNVRELKNIIERSILLNCSPCDYVLKTPSHSEQNSNSDNNNDTLQLATIEKNHILKILEQHDGNKTAAAKVLGVSRKTLERKVRLWTSDE
ncbi:MAG: sigma-54 dependent transcriptional regulator [Pseudomonadota bacterium]